MRKISISRGLKWYITCRCNTATWTAGTNILELATCADRDDVSQFAAWGLFSSNCWHRKRVKIVETNKRWNKKSCINTGQPPVLTHSVKQLIILGPGTNIRNFTYNSVCHRLTSELCTNHRGNYHISLLWLSVNLGFSSAKGFGNKLLYTYRKTISAKNYFQ